MTIAELKQWISENDPPDHAQILLAPAGGDYQEIDLDQLQYDNDLGGGEAVVIHFP